MKAVFTLALCLLAVFALTTIGVADKADKEEKEVTLKGNITCGKCELKQSNSCHTVVVVKDGGKEKVYWFDADGSKKYHEEICRKGKPGTVKGTVSEKDGKLHVKVSEVKFD